MRRSRPFTGALVALVALAAIVGACGPAATATPSATPIPTLPGTEPPATASPGPAGTPSGSGGTASVPYAITIPSTWESFDLADPAAKAGLDAFVAANPNLSASIQAFEAMPGVRMAINPLLGDFMLIITTPSNGLDLAALAPTFTAQFQAVPGLQGTPTPESLTLPGGDAVHWSLTLTSNKPGGGTTSAEESIYLFVSPSDAVILELVNPAGGAAPDEQSIVNSFRFTR